MSTWMSWCVLAGVLVIVELFTGTFYLLMIAVGVLMGALAAWLGWSMPMQFVSAAIVGSVATLALHNSRYGWKANQANHAAQRNPDVNLDIGQAVQVETWRDVGNGKYAARVQYRGAQWDVECRHAHAHPGQFIIEEVEGSRLIVRPA